MSVVFITHDFGVVAEIADRVIVMEKGHVVEQETAMQVLTAPAHPYTLARIIAMLIELPNETSVTEFAINCQLEESY
jgi:ABC-type dipeptide/oligopeptide/nickel transport system ATPase component